MGKIVDMSSSSSTYYRYFHIMIIDVFILGHFDVHPHVTDGA